MNSANTDGAVLSYVIGYFRLFILTLKVIELRFMLDTKQFEAQNLRSDIIKKESIVNNWFVLAINHLLYYSY
jgi:hypothetical protein